MKQCANHIRRRHRSVNVEEKPPIINLPSTREAILGVVIRRTGFTKRTTPAPGLSACKQSSRGAG